MSLENILKNKKEEKDILLMTHIVLGYPSFDTNYEVIKQMVQNGVDCIEMQIPFSEPMADGPVILKANQDSLAAGTTVRECLKFASKITAEFDIPFLFMTYYNIVYKYGEEEFFIAAQKANIKGFIIPDLPPEMATDYLSLAKKYQVDPIMIYAPTTTDKRMEELTKHSSGFIYCAARRGVTGKKTSLGDDFEEYLSRCRNSTSLPIAVGFGIQDQNDVQELVGKADIAVIGSQTIRLVDEKGTDAVGPFIASLRK
ncbi:MAG: tryptophan synthase subunit alpha [Desulfotalea sp.]